MIKKKYVDLYVSIAFYFLYSAKLIFLILFDHVRFVNVVAYYLFSILSALIQRRKIS